MNEQMNEQRVKELEELLLYHNEMYFNGSAEISDLEYDQLVAELKKLDATNSVLDEVGALPSFGRKVEHKIPLGSLNKITYEKDSQGDVIGDGMGELNAWLAGHQDKLLWAFKIDGLAIKIVYENGKLTQASTRGNGSVGQDITDNVRVIRSIPTTIGSEQIKERFGLHDFNCRVELRGEIYMPRSFFNEKMRGQKANPRNAAAGSLMCQDPAVTADRGLRFFCYKIYVNDKLPETELEAEELVNSIQGYHGIEHVNVEFVELHSFDLDAQRIDALNAERKLLDYETDGIVITVNDVERCLSYGYNQLKPKGQVAFKFRAEQKETEVQGITWQTGRTGRITPVAELKPVHVAGSTVSRCSLANYGEIKRLELAIGDTVLMEKAGDIIPKIIRVTKHNGGSKQPEAKSINYPEVCPACNQFTSNDGITVWCNNERCGERLLTRLVHYLNILQIKEVGPAMLTALIESGYVEDIPSLYYLNEDDIAKLPRSGLRTAETVMGAILSVTEVELDMFLASLGINNLGRTTSTVLAERFGTLEAIRRADVEDLVGLQDVGEVTARSIVSGLKGCSGMIDELNNLLTIKPYVAPDGELRDKTFCCTGKLSRKRDEIKRMIKDNGGKYTSIGKGLNYLIIGDGAREHKIEKAKSLGADIIEEEDFVKIAGGN